MEARGRAPQSPRTARNEPPNRPEFCRIPGAANGIDSDFDSLDADCRVLMRKMDNMLRTMGVYGMGMIYGYFACDAESGWH